MEKLKYIPFNLFWCLGTFIFIFIATLELPLYSNFWISIVVYMLDVKQSTDNDYLLDKIKKLEEEE